jgi:hypothetical protein
MDNTMMVEKKFYDKDDFASKSVAGTALGLGIGSLGLQLLNGGLGNFLGGITGAQNTPEQTAFGLYKGYRDADDAIIAKHNKDSFDLYKSQRDSDDAIMAQISAINAKLAVAEATQPWKDKAIYDAIALEAERRCCNDGKIVNYVNSTFVPKYVADLTPATGTTQASVFNPLCGCSCPTM